MAILKASETVQTDIKFKVIIAGFPGIGKTTLALSAPKPLLLDLDRGVNRVSAKHRKDTVVVENYDELMKDLQPENLTEYESLVIDTGGRLFDFLKGWAKQTDAKYIQSDGSLTLKGYGAVGKKFADFTNFCYYELKKNLIIVFHAKEEKDGDITKLRILVEGQTKENVWQPIDLGGFMEMNSNGERTIGFSNNERYFAKGCWGIKGTYAVPELTDGTPNNFLTNIFEKATKYMIDESKIYDGLNTDYEKVMGDVSPAIDGMTSETIMDAQNAIKNAAHVLTSERELKARFAQRLDEIGYKWDKGKKTYVSVKE